MSDNHDPRLKVSAIRARYNDRSWFTSVDGWHKFTATQIRQEVAYFWKSLPSRQNCIILNAGAGNNDFGLRSSTIINLDISEVRISQMPNPIVATVEELPLPDCSVDVVICVGSVINYCDAAATIAEFGRVLRSTGSLILEFESSYSAELIKQDAFRQAAAVAETFYADKPEAVWVYSPKYINNLLYAADFKIIRNVPIHVLSPWALLFLQSVSAAAVIARFDRIVKHFRPLSQWASNHLTFCEKKI